jgi:glycosyltransferase involved in cell wall biosynthesis
MRVGFYNRWLATLGGGEKHSLAIAEHLSSKHRVEVITHKPVPRQLVEDRLGLDMSRVEFITIPDRASIDVSLITSDYDLFINASYMDFFPSFARHSACLIYFPAKLDRKKAWGRQLKLALRKWLKLPAVMVGIPGFRVEGSKFIWSTDIACKIRLPYYPRPYQFRFELRPSDVNVRGADIYLEDTPVSSVRFPEGALWVPCEVCIPGKTGKTYRELTLVVHDNLRADGNTKMELSNLWMSLPHYRLYQEIFERRLFGLAVRLQHYPPGVSILDYIDTYNKIWANSEYTRKWIRHYWQRDSQVLYPLVDVEDFRVGEKCRKILNVGRFFAGQHNKKHLTLVEAFKAMVDQGLRDWELHLVGGKTPGEEHADYLEKIIQSAQDYPIFVHTEISYQELVNLYAESAIYWHASGYQEDEKKDPDKFEHFGITTVEAMASGCVPVVIGKGGQPEIIRHGVNGYLWYSMKELIESTRQLIDQPSMREKIAASALDDSKKYNRKHFRDRVDRLLQQIGFSS